LNITLKDLTGIYITNFLEWNLDNLIDVEKAVAEGSSDFMRYDAILVLDFVGNIVI